MNRLLAGILVCSALISSVLADTHESETQPSPDTEISQSEKSNSSGLYVGVEYFLGESSYDVSFSDPRIVSQSTDLDQDGFKVKFGAKLPSDIRIQGYFKNEKLEDTDNRVYGLGAEFLKVFELNSKLLPFIKGGAGYDWTELETDGWAYMEEDTLYAYSLKVGAGAMYKLTDTVELVGGLDLQYRKWQDIDVYYGYRFATIEQNDTSKALYAGINFHF